MRYAGATVAAWYPITPSTSVAEAFDMYCHKLRVDKETGKKKFAVIQAEDELAAIGMVLVQIGMGLGLSRQRVDRGFRYE